MSDGNDDENILRSLNEGDPEPEKAEEKPKKKKKEEQPKVQVAEVKSKPMPSIDPNQEFIAILKGMGVKEGKAELISDVFFKGDINDPAWLDRSLVLGDLSTKHRELVITSYYGATPEELGVELLPQNKAKMAQKAAGGQNAEVTGTLPLDIQKLNAEVLRNKFQALQNKQLLREFDRIEREERAELAEREKKNSPAPKKVIQRPMVSREGQIIKAEDGTPVMERIVMEGDGAVSGGGGLDGIVTVLLAKLLDDKKPTVAPVDPNVKPTWALDMERKMDLQKADDDKRRLEDEVKKEKEKREDLEKEYKKELDRVEAQHQRDIDRQREDTKGQLQHLSDRFDDERKHREEMDNIQSTYGGKFEELKKELDRTQKDIKTAVVSEVTKTGSKVIDRVTQTADSIITPLAEAYTEGMRLQYKVATTKIPDTNENELKQLI